jgi:hypothetical protein
MSLAATPVPVAEAADMRAQMAVHAVAIGLASASVLEVPMRHAWPIAVLTTLGALVMRRRFARDAHGVPPYATSLWTGFLFHLFVAAGAGAALALTMIRLGETLFPKATDALYVPLVLAAMAFGMNLLFGLTTFYSLTVARDATVIANDALHRASALRAPWRSALGGASVLLFLALPPKGGGLLAFVTNPATWLVTVALFAQLPVALADAALLRRSSAERRALDSATPVQSDPYREAPPPDPIAHKAALDDTIRYTRSALRRSALAATVCAGCLLAHWMRAR